MAGEVGRGLTIVYATPLTAVDGTIADLRHVAILMTIVAVLLLALILWRVMAAATKPIDSMIDVAARIGDGDFTARLDPAGLRGDAARLGVALNQMVARIQGAFAETSASEAKLRRFVADASHELRTPLTSIRGYAQLLRIGAAGDDAETATRRIDSEATRLALLVDDLLFLARLDQGRPLEREPVDMAAIVRELGADARLLDPTRSIEVEAPDAPVLVLGDEGRLRQLLTNLLANVRRHTPPRTLCALRVRSIDSDVLLTVADNGEGMAPDDATHAFDRFYRADASRSRDSGGSGLGLAIAKAIVDAHGGEIELTSAVGAGTSVRVRLPGAWRAGADERTTPHLTPTRQH
jgi:two-component system OmpR family sensor kinase